VAIRCKLIHQTVTCVHSLQALLSGLLDAATEAAQQRHSSSSSCSSSQRTCALASQSFLPLLLTQPTTAAAVSSAATSVAAAALQLEEGVHERLSAALVREIDALSSAEILRSLLAVTPVTHATLRLVRRCLRPLPPSEVTRLRLPLHFVLDSSSSTSNGSSSSARARWIARVRTLLDAELETNAALPLRHLGRYFFAVQPTSSSSNSTSSSVASRDKYSVSHWVILKVDARDALSGDSNSPDVSPERSYGTSLPPTSTVSGGAASSSGAVSGLGHHRFALCVSVAVHHPRGTSLYEQRAALVQGAVGAVAATAERVNRLLLLAHLHDTRVASDLLISREHRHTASASSTSSTSAGASAAIIATAATAAASSGAAAAAAAVHDSSDGSTDTISAVLAGLQASTALSSALGSSSSSAFVHGQFACPLKFSRNFTLNHRLQAR
jgi:hypothetical protein